ncbi:hypothetical protein GOP47_0013160 [Adiantum capillus-veneris]|uniref:tRNA-dihydrouridine(47) synthase [NAD(P)(+)] n=1 Tax=Adiantum capillus-veneris TaxID=13818 RepID=A0A9D4UN11_ADICA|nr:hypothetical protein GOP47_0013160 [Adiantum capillus-veneris]
MTSGEGKHDGGDLLPNDAESEYVSGGNNAEAELSVLELVAKARAPVKKDFLRTPGDRLPVIDAASIHAVAESENTATSKVSTTKKSKRQQKKERQVAKKSAENICNAVAKANDVNACPYGKDCRFNHDLEAFLAQKPPDLPGKCPFLDTRKPCPYGAACRFSGTHDMLTDLASRPLEAEKEELNNLRKDFQKILWKNHAVFPRADAQLMSLGILGKGKRKTPNCVSVEVTDVITMEIDPASQAMKVEGDVVDKQNNGTTFTNCELVENEKVTSEVAGGEDEEDAPARKKSKAYPTMPPDSAGTVSLGTASESPTSGDDAECRLTVREKKLVDFRGKLYVAPLTTVGNLPFRRVCKQLGADITCGEMAMCTNLLQGQASEWALLRRHRSEDLFGVQICGAYPDTVARTAEMIEKESEVDFIDINVGCPIDLVVNKGAGSCLLTKPTRLKQIVMATSGSLDTPLTVKVRMGYYEGKNCVQSFIGDIHDWGASALTIHGRTRQQRYSKVADWEYIYKTSYLASENLQVLGNGDIFSYTDWNEHISAAKLSTCMLARGVLIKPWLLTEIKEQRHWDISSAERFDIVKDYVRYGLQHWGSDAKGVETTRHFLLEWLSYMHRYIPVGLLEAIPQKLNWRPPLYYGRNDLETLMASDSAADWVRISEMLLGPPPASFSFTPRHKSNAYDRAENG